MATTEDPQIAQAVAQIAAQDSPLQQQATQPKPSSALVSADGGINCQWGDCQDVAATPELLYEHLCERHVGRKSTNNLNLTCNWGICRTTTVKRDHITSHLRVHIPLKPHKCEFCGKSFKRPQDLKKHVKTHADDSVLMRSPDAALGTAQNGQNFGGDNKNFYNNHDMHNGNYTTTSGQAGGVYNGSYPNPQGYNGYGQVNYPGTSLADQQSMDTRRRAIEALNDFLGDVKRRALDPHSYYDVGQRLNTSALPLPISTGHGYSIGSNYGGHGHQNNSPYGNLLESLGGGSGAGMNSHSAGPGVAGPLTQNYALPVPNARTKTDLLDIDRFLEQLQATVYESSNQSAAAGIQQPGIHTALPSGFGQQHTGSFRSSPPHAQHASHGTVSQAYTSSTAMGGMNATTDTPALTPASVSSYSSSGQSPLSSHSRSSGDGASMYPQLPSVTTMSEMGSGYSSAPPSGLASGFDNYDGRRYSGGRLQREAPAPRDEAAMDIDEEAGGDTTPRKMSLIREAVHGTSKNVDPALRTTPPAVTSPKSESTDDKAQETWVENVRVIEQLRGWISERLNARDYERSENSTPEPAVAGQHAVAPAADELMKDKKEDEDEPIAYPTLKAED